MTSRCAATSSRVARRNSTMVASIEASAAVTSAAVTSMPATSMPATSMPMLVGKSCDGMFPSPTGISSTGGDPTAPTAPTADPTDGGAKGWGTDRDASIADGTGPMPPSRVSSSAGRSPPGR